MFKEVNGVGSICPMSRGGATAGLPRSQRRMKLSALFRKFGDVTSPTRSVGPASLPAVNQ